MNCVQAVTALNEAYVRAHGHSAKLALTGQGA
jgi:hypothetical protein